MDSKKRIMSFIKPSATLAIVMMIPPLTLFGIIILLTTTLPASMHAKKSIDAKKLVNGRIVLTDNYIFCKFIGYVIKYSDIIWAYKGRKKGCDTLFIATKDISPVGVASKDFDRMDEVKNALIEIYKHNNQCMIGYTNENISKYEKLSAQ